MIALIDLQTAKERIKLTNTESDADLQNLIYQASAFIMTHIKRTTTAEWLVEDSSPEATVIPYDIQCAVCLEVADLNANREGSGSGVLSDAVVRLLRAYRDPTLA